MSPPKFIPLAFGNCHHFPLGLQMTKSTCFLSGTCFPSLEVELIISGSRLLGVLNLVMPVTCRVCCLIKKCQTVAFSCFLFNEDIGIFQISGYLLKTRKLYYGKPPLQALLAKISTTLDLYEKETDGRGVNIKNVVRTLFLGGIWGQHSCVPQPSTSDSWAEIPDVQSESQSLPSSTHIKTPSPY